MKRKLIKEIDGVCIRGCSFGIRKCALSTVAKAKDIIKFKELLQTKDELYRKARRHEGNHWARPPHSVLGPIDSQLRGFRKYWRTMYTDSFSEGLYIAHSPISWQGGRCVGELGSSWQNQAIRAGDIFMYVQHDRLGNVELMNTKNSELIKLPRGNAVCDKIIRFKKGEENE